MSSPKQPTRYRVCFGDGPDVTYDCALGAANARRWALDTAQNHGGKVLVEYNNGSAEEVKSFGMPVLPSETPQWAG